MERKGIILAGGAGTRLRPMTLAVNKHLLPVYDKPMVCYPLSVLMLAGIRDILVISTPEDLPRFQALFGDGSQVGLALSYTEQPEPRGLADAFLLAEDFLAGRPAALILGDNLFYGQSLSGLLNDCAAVRDRAVVFAYHVRDPRPYAVATFDRAGRVVAIDEKPERPRSNWAIAGLYFYDSAVVEFSRRLRPSARGELEITDLNRLYLEEGRLEVKRLGRGHAWMDMGTEDSLLQAANFVQAIDQRQGLKIACIEEIAWRLGWIATADLLALAEGYKGTRYHDYLHQIAGADG